LLELSPTETFTREFNKLEKKEKERIVKKVEQAIIDPWLYFKRLKRTQFFKLRVGKYRIIAKIILKENKISLLSVKHRKKVYQEL